MNKDFYSDSAWGASNSRTVIEQRELLAIKIMSHRLQSDSTKMLDLGCGDGCFLEALSKRFANWKLSGADGSSVQISKAQLRLPSAELKIADFSASLPFADSEFDVLFIGEIIEHMINPDDFLKEARRVLKDGGLICLTTPNLLAWYNRCLILLGFSPIFVEYSTTDARVGYGWLKGLKAKTPVGHLRIYQPDALKDLLELTGFKNVEIKSARFEYLPAKMSLLDSLISRIWVRGGSILVASAIKG